MLERLSRIWRRPSPEPCLATAPTSPPATLAGDTHAAGTSTSEWIHARLARASSYAEIPDAALDRLRRDPLQMSATVAAADRVLRHEFDLLGSGPFTSVDPERPPSGAYRPIDWYFDPVQQLRFPRGVPYKAWKLYEMRPGTADVKHPWELARCQHWATLGQAFRLTGDERYAREIALVRQSPALAEAFWVRAYSALFDHGVFIRGNLENTYEVTSNHFLSNVVGLWFLASAFARLPAGEEWAAFARESLEREIDVQVLSDGADFESAVPYHRLVAELFLGCLRLADLNGAPLSAHYRQRTRDMVIYLAGVLRPDGLMPQVGDADDGRLHVFTGYGSTSPQDPRHLFGPAAVLFDEPQWAALAGAAGRWEAAWWGLETDRAIMTLSDDPTLAAHLFRDAGVAVARTRDSYLLVTNGIVGTKGFGNHKHNDQLAFEFHSGGTPLLVDPGSYVYTSDAAGRNRFRGTAYHNTLCVDGGEQNEINPEWLFRMFEKANAEHVSFAHDAGGVEYVGRHHGYERLDAPVTHERRLRLDAATGRLAIVDRLTGRGAHELRWHFHFAPGIDVRVDGESALVLAANGRRWRLAFPADLRAAVTPAEYSPSYGVRRPCLAADLTTKTALEGERRWEFSIQP
jgi:hypothetical protein